MNKKVVILAAALILAAIAAHLYQPSLEDVNVPLTSISDELHVTTLENGLTITAKEMHALPLVTIQFWVNVGSKNEPENYRGIAHIFEHIWFKGTETQPVGSFHKTVESLGGELNAMTSHDWTMYYVTVPSDKFDTIFPLMVDLLRNPAFDEAEIEKEKEVVLEEQRFSFNEPEKYLDDQFALTLIKDHPYQHPIIGYKDTITAPNRTAIMNFYNTWYAPNNMNIIIVGDMDSQRATQQVASAFGDLQPQPLPPLNLPEEQPRQQPQYNSSFKDIGYTYVALGYLAPPATSADRYATRVLNTIWAGGDGSRLEQIVKKQKNLIVRGQSVYAVLTDLGVVETLAVVEPENAGAAKAELILQLNRFKTQPVTQEELERAKALIRADRVKSQEEIFQVGFDIGNAWIDGDLAIYQNYIDNINAVTAEDVQRVAQKYFTAYTMYELKPKL